ncbi:MAG: chromosomal replication initiator protein DnaA [Aggregatilineales bacterium]
MNAQDAWNAAYGQLELQLDRANFDTWLRDAFFICEEENGVYVIGVRNSYARDMLQHRLYRNIRRVLSDVCGVDVELRFEVNRPVAKDLPAHENGNTPSANKQPDLFVDTQDDRPLFKLLAQRNAITETDNTLPPLYEQIRRPGYAELPENDLNPDHVFDRFVVSGSNQMAYEAARAVAENPARMYNPFMIYGGVGLGKTHLVHAIAHVCTRQGLRAVFIPSEVFTNDLVDAIRHKTTAMFREKYRSADVLLVDDIQFIAGKESTQEEFFHTFNALHTFQKQIVLVSDRHPRELSTLEDRLRSRFESGLIVDIKPMEYEARVAILRMWAKERKIRVDPAVIDMIAHSASNNVRGLQGVFTQIVAKAHLTDRPITVENVGNLLEHFERPREYSKTPADQATPTQIIEAVAAHFNLNRKDLEGKKRATHINNARQVAMYLLRELTDISLSQIGDFFGGRSHTTVLHACNKITESLDNDPNIRRTLQEVQNMFGNKR